MIRVVLPHHLRNLAHVGAELSLDVAAPVSIDTVLDALETKYPMLTGTIRDHTTKVRRPFLRFFACGEDLSNDPTDVALPISIVTSKEPLLIIGASLAASRLVRLRTQDNDGHSHSVPL